MPGKLTILPLVYLLFLVAFQVKADDFFGMRLTTEEPKAKDNTQYRFRYFVKDDTTGDYKIQEETKEGDSVHGSYTIAEPNGDLRTVTYKAGPGRGFEARVDVQPSGSPMKATTASVQTEVESKVKDIPGGFVMDVLRKSTSEKTETGMKFSFNTEPSNASTVTEKLETTTSETTLKVEMENATFSTEGRDISEDSIEREIDETINSMPKLPELVLSDNKTHFKFHKDPEEALLDERITQIARQLAETSLRREYEERKLGHFLPISVRPIEHSTLSKSFKFTDVPDFRSSEPSPLPVLTPVRVLPQYITEIPKFSSLYHRVPVVNKPFFKTEAPRQETVITTAQDKSEGKLINKILKLERPIYGTADPELISMMPFNIPTFFQFFSPFQRYVMQPQGNLLPPNKPQFFISPLAKETAGAIPIADDTTFYTMVNNNKQ